MLSVTLAYFGMEEYGDKAGVMKASRGQPLCWLPEALLAGNNDLRSLFGHLLLHLVQKLGVGLHMAAPKPPPAHT